jgi:hypothetical protein
MPLIVLLWSLTLAAGELPHAPWSQRDCRAYRAEDSAGRAPERGPASRKSSCYPSPGYPFVMVKFSAPHAEVVPALLGSPL